MAPEFGFEVEQVEAVDFQDRHISSTQIRNALMNGEINTANEMLGYHYSVSGEVIHGKKLGRTIGYPTANISVNPLKFLPKKGAYIVDVFVKNKQFRGMLSIGTNPTRTLTQNIQRYQPLRQPYPGASRFTNYD